ncbi:arginine/serine-rich coiled-coil protein 2-like [Oppia nitens]|uniref:arginine/serine-rich coiled-coil protein 2-like n=1 Tax=Oppia nitens TaxID=1686743 RepID=UPI0023DA2E85|nr:arginine/serine-rich coiled-coil protein 2-like [Oppia nitens]
MADRHQPLDNKRQPIDGSVRDNRRVDTHHRSGGGSYQTRDRDRERQSTRYESSRNSPYDSDRYDRRGGGDRHHRRYDNQRVERHKDSRYESDRRHRQREETTTTSKNSRKRYHSRSRSRDRSRDKSCDRSRERSRDRSHDTKRSKSRSRSASKERLDRKVDDQTVKDSIDKCDKTKVIDSSILTIKNVGIGGVINKGEKGGQHKVNLEIMRQQVEAKTGITVPTYYNPGVVNPMKFAEQQRKRKLLWSRETATDDTNTQELSPNDTKSLATSNSQPSGSATNRWNGLKFEGEKGNEMTEKFKKLMGIKDKPELSSSTICKNESVIQSQETLFRDLDIQYSIARISTHTQRGVGLGFGGHQK